MPIFASVTGANSPITSRVSSMLQGSPPPSQPPRPEELRDQIRSAIEQTRQAVRDAQNPQAASTQDRGAEAPAVEQPRAIITIPSDPNRIPDIPPRAEGVAYAFLLMLVAVVVLTPIARAIGRFIDRKAQAPARLPAEVNAQLSQLSQAVDAIAIEVERISEGQRFTTKLLSDIQARRGTLLVAASPEHEYRNPSSEE